jgi:AcrR family transcriptional regulator
VPQETSQSSRQRLIDAAAELFYSHGVGAVGVDLISKAAGVSKRTLYQEFGSKDQLVAQALAAKGDEVVAMYLGEAESVPGPETAPGGDAAAGREIMAVFGRMGNWTGASTFRGCPFINTCTELADPGHPARRVASSYNHRLREYFARQAERAGADDPWRLAAQLVAVFDGAIVQTVMGAPLDPGSLQAAARALLDAQGAAR